MNKNCFGKIQNYLLIIFFSLSATFALGQGSFDSTKWRFSNPQQFGFTVLDVDYFDDNNAIAVGSDGGIAITRDAGANWTYGPFTFVRADGFLVKTTFNDVHFVTAAIAYAVGNDGCMAKTTDGGASWQQVITPLTSNQKIINACWFLDANKGYIGGDYNNTIDSLPKLYVTMNGGASWDSIAAPAVNGVSRVGYINNPLIPSVLRPVDAKLKSIFRIEFINDSTGYVCGSNSYGVTLFPPVSFRATSATNCTPLTTNLTSGSMAASLLWKFKSGVLTDYSLSKERIGYTGINTNTINCTSTFATVTPVTQQYRAMNIINDSTVVLMSFNNNTVVKVHTGNNDSTANVNAPGVFEKGKYEVLNFPFPPTQGPNAGPPIPNPQVLLASNPYQLRRTSNGTLIANGNFGRMWTSVDTGRNWVQSRSLPPGQNYSASGVWALDIAPNGRFLSMGTNGVVADSLPGNAEWRSNYLAVPASAGFTKMEFADCNHGTTAGSSNINVTRDGGKSWIDRGRPDFASSFYSINGFSYRNSNPAQSYFAVSNGTIYYSGDTAITLDPVYADGLMQMNDVATVGNDSVWAVGYTSFSVPSASRTSRVYRSFDAGATWNVYSGFSMGSTAQNLTDIEFPTSLIGYASGNRDTIYKTTDAGVTWNKLPLPTPGVTPQITYKDLIALDANTVFVIGNGFPRKVIFRTTDGGATWTDISNNITTLGVGNLNSIVMHDINNGYVMTPGLMCKTTDGGTTWTLEIPPTNCLFETGAFAPKRVPASVSFANRKFFLTGVNVSGAPIMEYGNPADIAVNATESVTDASCTNPAGGSITINATGAIAPYMYSIDGGTFQASNMFTGLTQGPKTITIKDSFCGLLTKTINVGFNDNLALTTNNDTLVCAGAPVTMLAATNGTGTAYAWTPAGGLSATNISNPVATVNSNAAFTVTATLNGCVRTGTVNISIKPNPVISAGSDKTIVDGDQVQLNGSSAANAVSIAWTPAATLTNANSYTPVAKPATTTTYTLTVRDNNNCTSTDDAIVTVIPYCMKVMNAFTPNGDGMNDRWLVTNGAPCTNNIKVGVYNRYGNVIYTNNNYANDWDGTFNGKPVADGTYYYTVTFRTITGKLITLAGDVTILR